MFKKKPFLFSDKYLNEIASRITTPPPPLSLPLFSSSLLSHRTFCPITTTSRPVSRFTPYHYPHRYFPAFSHSPYSASLLHSFPPHFPMGLPLPELERSVSPGPASSPSSSITLERNECYRDLDN